jgi:hypothetical protein
VELSPEDEQRIAWELRRVFEEKGWRLSVQQEDGEWVASFFHTQLGPTTAHEVRGRTPLEAAHAAWAKYKHEPYLGGSSQPTD